jgi:hypothetical protein
MKYSTLHLLDESFNVRFNFCCYNLLASLPLNLLVANCQFVFGDVIFIYYSHKVKYVIQAVTILSSYRVIQYYKTVFRLYKTRQWVACSLQVENPWCTYTDKVC